MVNSSRFGALRAAITLMFCGFVCVTSVSGQAPSPETQIGRITVAHPSFDFGVVPQGTLVRHDFEIKNAGTAPLRIERVITECGCTASAATKDILEPGETAAVTATFDTSAFSGDREKGITVLTNDPQARSTRLTLKGRIEAGVTVEPEVVSFGEIARGSEAQRELAVSAAGAGNKVVGAKSLSKWITVREGAGDDRRRTFTTSITPDALVGDLRTRVVVEIQGEGGKSRSVNVPIFASVKGPVRLAPPVVSLGILEGSDPIVRTVSLEYQGRGEMEIATIATSDSAIDATAKEEKKGKKFSLNVSVDPSKTTKDLKGAVTVVAKLPDGAEETVSLSVFGTRPPR